MKFTTSLLYFFAISTIILSSCTKHRDSTVGWEYNNPRTGGFQKVPFVEQETAPNMILIERSTTLDSLRNTLDVSSFYISAYEETNGQYLTYLNFIQKFYPEKIYQEALPDTTVWLKSKLGESNQQYLVNHYLRNPQFKDYPVIGLKPEQIEKYAIWKTDRINESILVREELIQFSELTAKDPFELFSTEKYYKNQYTDIDTSVRLINLDPDDNKKNIGSRIIRMEDGILLPRYRLPSPDEWKLAALAIGDNDHKYVKTDRPFYKKRRVKKHQYETLWGDFSKIDKAYYKSSLPMKPVNASKSNSYRVFGLSNDIVELVKDTLNNTYAYMGSSSNDDENDYSAIYHKEKPKSSSYYSYSLFDIEMSDSLNPPYYKGFRLARDRIGFPAYKKRKKAPKP